MSFFSSIGNFFKDTGTSIGRIVTDTGIDITNVVTGFQFNNQMEKAKESMSDAGFKSASDAIRDNYYGHVLKMEKTVESLNKELKSKIESFRAKDEKINNRLSKYGLMVGDLNNLINTGEAVKEALAAREKSTQIPIDLPPKLPTIKEFHMARSDAIKAIEISALANAGLSSGVLLAWTGAKLGSKIAKSASSAAKASRIAGIAGKANVALTLVSIGLDVGFSIASLEQKAKELPEFIKDQEADIKVLNDELSILLEKSKAIEQGINRILSIRNPPIPESEWDIWVELRIKDLRAALTQSISMEGNIEKAEVVARNNRKIAIRDRIKEIKTLFPNLLRTEIVAIIKIVDSEK
ncbi:hypothetical protein [Enterovibrio norvegicus]|uniref:hypothetical protein n=1 Tax=Enterovibrio norvegicus TaxID=188144 RepID=UPI0024B212E1|nr:hypothetical protein [Enterovibrio norvegicus]